MISLHSALGSSSHTLCCSLQQMAHIIERRSQRLHADKLHFEDIQRHAKAINNASSECCYLDVGGTHFHMHKSVLVHPDRSTAEPDFQALFFFRDTLLRRPTMQAGKMMMRTTTNAQLFNVPPLVGASGR